MSRLGRYYWFISTWNLFWSHHLWYLYGVFFTLALAIYLFCVLSTHQSLWAMKLCDLPRINLQYHLERKTIRENNRWKPFPLSCWRNESWGKLTVWRDVVGLQQCLGRVWNIRRITVITPSIGVFIDLGDGNPKMQSEWVIKMTCGGPLDDSETHGSNLDLNTQKKCWQMLWGAYSWQRTKRTDTVVFLCSF